LRYFFGDQMLNFNYAVAICKKRGKYFGKVKNGQK